MGTIYWHWTAERLRQTARIYGMMGLSKYVNYVKFSFHDEFLEQPSAGTFNIEINIGKPNNIKLFESNEPKVLNRIPKIW